MLVHECGRGCILLGFMVSLMLIAEGGGAISMMMLAVLFIPGPGWVDFWSCMITRTFTTVDDLHESSTMGTCCCTKRASNNLARRIRTATVGSRPYPTLRTNPLDLHNKDIEHRINRPQLGNHCGLLHETKGNVLCAMTGKSTTLHSLTVRNCLCK